MLPHELPLEFQSVAFSAADARAAGIGDRRLRASDLRTPHHGVRAPAATHPASVEARCRELLPRMASTHVFIGPTALALWGAPVPRWTSAALHVGALLGGREPRLTGVTGRRLSLPISETTLIRGLPVVDPVEAWAQSAAPMRLDAPSPGGPVSTRSLRLTELVASADFLLAHRLADRAELAEVAAVARRRGALALRDAAELARPGVESPKETELRLLLLDGGLPEPEINWNLFAATSRHLARLDLAYPRYRVAVEYDGRHHAEPAQFSRDADRWAEIADEGWLLIRVLAHHLENDRAAILRRVRRALRSRGWPSTGG